MAQTGCPSSREFNWKIGYRFQDLDASFKSAEFHLAAHVAAGDVNQFFCIKNSGASDKSVPVWPSGDYCIYQRGAKCPATSGTFEAGYVLWDDENGANGNQNKNNKGGALPAGIYNNDTLMRFCCQVNGSVDDPIVLPVDDPFYLMVYKGNCQEVLGTIRIPENICYDTEDTDNHDAVEAPYPLRAVRKTPCIDFCYYQRKYLHTHFFILPAFRICSAFFFYLVIYLKMIFLIIRPSPIFLLAIKTVRIRLIRLVGKRKLGSG